MYSELPKLACAYSRAHSLPPTPPVFASSSPDRLMPTLDSADNVPAFSPPSPVA